MNEIEEPSQRLIFLLINPDDCQVARQSLARGRMVARELLQHLNHSLLIWREGMIGITPLSWGCCEN